MSRPSATVAGVFSDSEMIQRTGNSAKTRTMASAATHRPTLRSMSAPLPGRLQAEALDEHHGYERHADEDQHGYRRAQAEVQLVEQLVVAQDRDRLDVPVLTRVGQDVDRVEDPESVERAEEQRDEDRDLHQRDRDLPEPLPGARSVHARGLVQLVGDERQPREQQERHEGRRLPDLRQDRDADR